jgi:hypothetical protein
MHFERTDFCKTETGKANKNIEKLLSVQACQQTFYFTQN